MGNSGKLSIVVIIVSAIFLLAFLFFVIFSIFSLEKTFETEEENVSTRYQYLEYDTNTNSSEIGIVSNLGKMEENEYIFYENENKLVLISNFGSKEYRCDGTCSCQDGRRSSGAVVFSRGLMLLIASVSSVLVYETAKKSFETECEAKYTSHCESDVIAEVDDCKDLSGGTLTEIDVGSMVKKKVGDDARYWCEGSCVDSYFHEEELKLLVKNFGCAKMEMSAEVKIIIGKDEDGDDLAKKEFLDTQLQPLCETETMMPVRYIWVGGERDKNERDVQIPLCRGKLDDQTNPSVVCRKM